MSTPSPPYCRLDLAPPLADRFILGVAPIDYGPALLLMPFGFHLAMDTLPSGIPQEDGSRSALAVSDFRLRARLGFPYLPSLPGQRGITPAFGYGAPHPSARGTSTLLNNALLSAHYEAIRLPVPHLPFSLFSCPAYSLYSERDTGSPGLPCNHNVRHAMVSDPGEVCGALPLAASHMLTSTVLTVLSFPTKTLRGSFPSSFRLTAYLLAVLRLKLYVTIQPPRTCYPVAG